MKKVDVVIIGAGLAGSCLARQLKLTLPQLQIVVLEKVREINDWKVGEATVELGSHYLMKKVRLTNYLFRHHLPKNGLRYFFDSAEKDLPIDQMSEMGTSGFPPHASFLIDRKVLEGDLVQMNRQAGINVFLKAKVTGLKIQTDDSQTYCAHQEQADHHEVTYVDENGEQKIYCRWVCDASGRRQILLRTLGIKTHPETRLQTAAAWGRFKGVIDIDNHPNNEWRERVFHSTRMMATLHFMYKGYWIWVIPVAEGIYSIGVVYDREIYPNTIDHKNFLDFLNSHRCLRDMLENSELCDFKAFRHLPYFSDQYYSHNRWAVTGEAGAFTDPFYSPGTDFIGISNDLITSLIQEDVQSKNLAMLKTKTQFYNKFYQERYDRTIRLYIDNYRYFGSFNLMGLKYFMDLCNYYNLFYWAYQSDLHLDLTWIEENLEHKSLALKINQFQNELINLLYEDEEKNGEYYKNNQEQWNNISQSTKRIFDIVQKKYNGKGSRDFLEETLKLSLMKAVQQLDQNKELDPNRYLLKERSLIRLIQQINLGTEKTMKSIVNTSLDALT